MRKLKLTPKSPERGQVYRRFSRLMIISEFVDCRRLMMGPCGLRLLRFVVFGRELDRPSLEEGTQFLSGLFDPEMFGDMRFAQPLHRRCEAGDLLEPLNRSDAGDLCLPIAKTDLFDRIGALEGFITLEYELNES